MVCRVQYSQQMPRVPKIPRSAPSWLLVALLLIWCVGMFGRGYWTPDEPREADIAWRMSWQSDKAVPLLAGEAFCEKPPLTYWLAAVPIKLIGAQAWCARLPNLLYALITALGVGLLAARSAGRIAGLVGAAAYCNSAGASTAANRPTRLFQKNTFRCAGPSSPT